MNIVYFPGFNSSPASEKSSLLQQHFAQITIPNYNTWNPDTSYAQLQQIIEPLLTAGVLLIGSSLGGFWAYQFACRYHQPCLLINPCMHPEHSLHRYIGKVENFYTQAQGWLTETNLAQYPYYRMRGKPSRITVLHEQGDELIPYHESVINFSGKAKLILPGGGHHRFSRTELIVNSIHQMLVTRALTSVAPPY